MQCAYCFLLNNDTLCKLSIKMLASNDIADVTIPGNHATEILNSLKAVQVQIIVTSVCKMFYTKGYLNYSFTSKYSNSNAKTKKDFLPRKKPLFAETQKMLHGISFVIHAQTFSIKFLESEARFILDIHSYCCFFVANQFFNKCPIMLTLVIISNVYQLLLF